MNKKKRTLYLLISVVAIYAAIITRFLFLSDEGDAVELANTSVNTFTPTQYQVQKNFKIINNYRDPFLGDIPRKVISNKTDTSISIQEPENTFFPEVQYLGVISDTGGAKKVLSLRINSREYVLREGSVTDSIQIISGDQKKMVVSFKGKKKVINISGQ